MRNLRKLMTIGVVSLLVGCQDNKVEPNQTLQEQTQDLGEQSQTLQVKNISKPAYVFSNGLKVYNPVFVEDRSNDENIKDYRYAIRVNSKIYKFPGGKEARPLTFIYEKGDGSTPYTVGWNSPLGISPLIVKYPIESQESLDYHIEHRENDMKESLEKLKNN